MAANTAGGATAPAAAGAAAAVDTVVDASGGGGSVALVQVALASALQAFKDADTGTGAERLGGGDMGKAAGPQHPRLLLVADTPPDDAVAAVTGTSASATGGRVTPGDLQRLLSSLAPPLAAALVPPAGAEAGGATAGATAVAVTAADLRAWCSATAQQPLGLALSGWRSATSAAACGQPAVGGTLAGAGAHTGAQHSGGGKHSSASPPPLPPPPSTRMVEVKRKLDGRPVCFELERWLWEPQRELAVGRWVAPPPPGTSYGLPPGAYSWGVWGRAAFGDGNVTQAAPSDTRPGHDEASESDALSLAGDGGTSVGAYRMHHADGSLRGYRFDVLEAVRFDDAASASECSQSLGGSPSEPTLTFDDLLLDAVVLPPPGGQLPAVLERADRLLFTVAIEDEDEVAEATAAGLLSPAQVKMNR